MSTDRSRPVTELRRYRLFCPHCGRGILPLASIGAFVCKNAHRLSILELVLCSPFHRRALGRLIEEWESQGLSLKRTSDDARRQGLLVVAEVYSRQAGVLAERAATFRKGFEELARLFISAG